MQALEKGVRQVGSCGERGMRAGVCQERGGNLRGL